MIYSEQRQVFGSHVIDIGKGKEYGYVEVKVTNSAFTVAVFDQYDRPVKHEIYPIKRELTAQELAFMEAYDRNVSGASPNEVEAYLRAENHDEFIRDYGHEYYTGLADAHGMWMDALAYAKDPAYFAKQEKKEDGEDDNYILIS